MENLYQRCTRQSNFLNHSEYLKHAKSNGVSKSSSGSSGHGEGGEDKSAGGRSGGDAAETAEIEGLREINAKIKDTAARLDVIGNYVIDFNAIADSGLKSARLRK